MLLRRILLLSLFSIILVSCSTYPGSIKTVEVPPEAVITPTLAKEIPSDTAVEKEECIDLIEDGRLTGNGYLILLDMLKSADDPFIGSGMIMNTSTLETMIVDKGGWYPDISPSGSAIAFLDYDSSTKLAVSTEDETYTFPNEKITYFYWVNDDIIAIKEDYKPDTCILLLNPFSGKLVNLETNFPEMPTHAAELINPWAGKVTSFNASLTYVIYPGSIGSNIFNLIDRTVVRNIPLSPYHYSPTWSPTGDRFLMGFPVGDNAELASISVENEVTMLTNFSSTYSNFAVSSYSWSPDGQRIAFWFSEGDYYNDSEKSLVFIDLAKNDLTMTCMSSQSFIFDAEDNVIWSPDSRQVAVRFYPVQGKLAAKAIVDVTKLSYRIIPDDYDLTPKGWLAFEPEIK